ncbi:ZNG1 [Auxenochlorella protothecoides x Auxenochlorella symbiontica]
MGPTERDMDADDEVPMAVSLTEQAGTTRVTRETPSYRQNLSLDGPLKPVPVTLITGYLGAGKSTLINRILNTQHGYRCAVLMNEFGESADVERALIKEPEGEEASPLANWVQLENGCICCSVKNDMVKALEALLQQRASFDYILIETTGLANPGPVAAALWTDAELEAGVCLDAVVTVVDARNIRRQLADPPGEGAEVCEAAAQIAFADVVLLNKVGAADVGWLGEAGAHTGQQTGPRASHPEWLGSCPVSQPCPGVDSTPARHVSSPRAIRRTW